ncbi:hypothetical protein K8P63_04980 [Sphingomonas nostoxanthinifaciens]|nr:hypothetical protein K8P63_04980 [Sphingomonas nostoxanthinifaciens]
MVMIVRWFNDNVSTNQHLNPPVWRFCSRVHLIGNVLELRSAAWTPDAKPLRALEENNARPNRRLADTMLDNARLKDLLSKKQVMPAAEREAVAHIQTALGMSERRACAVVGADRKSTRYRLRWSDYGDLRSHLRWLAQRGLPVQLSAAAHPAAPGRHKDRRKKTERIYREEV